MAEVKITEEAIRRAADKCPAAKEVLKELFPSAFKSIIMKVGNHYRVGKKKQIVVLARTGDYNQATPVLRFIDIQTGERVGDNYSGEQYTGDHRSWVEISNPPDNLTPVKVLITGVDP